MNFKIHCVFFVTLLLVPTLSCTRRSLFMQIRQRKCAFGGEAAPLRPAVESRRQQPKFTTIVPTTAKTTRKGPNLSQKEILELMQRYRPQYDIGPKKSHSYDPSVGYEPYWVGGEWVYMTNVSKSKGKAKEKKIDMCGNECSLVYKNYGVICGRNKHFEYKTFPNYCALVDYDCSRLWRWLISYRGPCQHQDLKTFPTSASAIVSRVEEYLANFKSTHRKEAG